MRLLAIAIRLAALILGLLSLLPHLLTQVWWIDLFAHFKVQYLVAGLLLAVISLVFRQRAWLIILILIICILNVAFIIPYFIPTNPGATSGLKIASINLYSGNREAHRVLAYVTERDPDILVLLEYNEVWAMAMDDLKSSYPYFREVPQTDNFGIALFSRKPVDINVLIFPDMPVSFQLTGSHAGRPFRLIATHPVPPVGKTYFDKRNLQLARLTTLLNDRTKATMLAGDLNTSPFSQHFRNLLQEAPHMHDARKGFGLAPTWPSGWWFAGTALDHILVSDDLKVTSFETGPDIGSDHLPVMISVDF